MPTVSFDLKTWARRGAETRLAEIRQEIALIYATFPELRIAGGQPRRGRPPTSVQATSDIEASPVSVGPPKRKKFSMSAEGRERIAAAQRKRWAKIRKQKKAS